MNSATEHIFKQVEWFEKLKSKYRCIFVELEHKFLDKHFRADVYGKTEDGEIFIVEIGHVNYEELKALKRLTGRKKHIKLIIVPLLSQEYSKLEKEQISWFSEYSWVEVM